MKTISTKAEDQFRRLVAEVRKRRPRPLSGIFGLLGKIDKGQDAPSSTISSRSGLLVGHERTTHD
jgi:hypothetical protein